MPPKRNQHRPKSRHKNSKNPGENAMADCVLPQDMMVAILSRLPVKSLVRFKSVCKPWYKLVTNPSFIKIHSQISPHIPKTLSFQSHVLQCPILGIDPHTNLIDVYFDSCNGLVCLGRPLLTRDIVLWNPATNMHKILPPSTIQPGAASMVSLGFGCSADGDDYKVVRISVLKGKKMRAVVEVYSSKSDSWRKFDLNLGYKFTFLAPKNHVIANGNPYWLACLYESKNIDEGRQCEVLLGFDATRMEFMVLPLPNVENMGGEKLPFVNWKGHVGVISCHMKKDADDWLEWIVMWVYDDGQHQWRRDARYGPLEVQLDMCLDISRAGKIIGGCPDGKLFLYDPTKNRVSVSKLRRREKCSVQIFAYDESLMHLKGMVPVRVKKEDHGDEFNDLEGFFVCNLCHRTGEISCYHAVAF